MRRFLPRREARNDRRFYAGAGYTKTEPTAQARRLRFFLTEDAFYLLVGKVLRLKGLGDGAGYHPKSATGSFRIIGHWSLSSLKYKTPRLKRGIFYRNSSFFSSNAGNFSFLDLPSFITKKYKESNVIRKTIKNGYGE